MGNLTDAVTARTRLLIEYQRLHEVNTSIPPSLLWGVFFIFNRSFLNKYLHFKEVEVTM